MFLHTRGGKVRLGFYACTAYHKRGRAVCQNNLEIKMEAADQAVVGGIRETVLRAAIVDAALDQALATLAEPTPGAVTTASLEAELSTLNGEIERLVTAMAAGGDLPALVEALRTRERRRQDIAEQLAGSRQNAPARFDKVALRAELQGRLRDGAGCCCATCRRREPSSGLCCRRRSSSRLMPIPSDAAIATARACTLAV